MTYRQRWHGSSYDALAAPMTSRGNDLVLQLPLRGDETVLDAGCGTGQVTATLLARLPHGRVVALDGSESMLEVARERLGHDARVTFVHADLARPLPLEEPLDAIVSTSTFHWVRDHDALFGHLAVALRPGGRLAFECGGHGNVASAAAILDELGHGELNPWTFATPEETRRRLEAAGFEDVSAQLVPLPAPLAPEDLTSYLKNVVLAAHVAVLGEEAGDALAAAVAERMPAPVIDYVRLRATARRAAR